MQSRLPGFHAVKFLEFASHAICARMSFSSVWVSVPASTLEWAHRFSGKGWWLAQPPSPSPKRCFSGKWGRISQGMTLPRAHLFCFFSAFVFFWLFLFVFFVCFLPQFFAISFKKYPVLEVPNSGTFPFGWSPVHLAGVSLNIGRSSSASRVHLGPPFSSLMFPLSSAQVFTTLSRLICCFMLFPCVLHLALSLFPGCISSVYILHHVASFQLALVPSMYSSFVKCAPFQVAFAISIFHPFAIFVSFQLAFCFPIFLHFSCVPLSDLRVPIPFFGIVSPFFQVANILEQSQFDSIRIRMPTLSASHNLQLSGVQRAPSNTRLIFLKY